MAALTNLGMRIQESLNESTRDFNFRSPNAEYFDTGEEKVKKIRRQLDSTSERDILEAMKRLVALISKGRNVSEFFAQVVKNVGSHNLEIRKLVYIYLLRYADSEPDLALLSINTFQKDLSDHNPLIRAMALRVLSGIRVPMIGSIVALGIKKCASDVSPYVRKAAALAIPKCYSLSSTHLSTLMEILKTLLRDGSPLSIGAVALAFNAICPNRLDLLHPQYRRYCRILSDADEWGQVQLLDLLTRYARTMLTAPIDDVDTLDPDLRLLLKSAEPLFQSRNPAVTMAVVRTFYYVAPESEKAKVISPLLSLMSRSPEIERVVLGNCLLIARDQPTLLHKYLSRFFVRANDLSQTKCLKVQILSRLVTPNNATTLVQEFNDYALDVDDELVARAIKAIGSCATSIPEAVDRCLSALMGFMKSTHEVTISNAVLVLKSLYQHQLAKGTTASKLNGITSSPPHIIAKLARKIDSIRQSTARATVIWLVGQYAPSGTNEITAVPGMADWAPDVLRKMAKSFPDEADLVRLQVITLAAKLLVLSPSTTVIQQLAQYVFAQARYDANLDVRDRARTVGALLKGLKLDLDGSDDAIGSSLYDEDDADVVPNEETWERRAREKSTESGGGVVLRVEQARMVLFEGKSLTKDDEDENQIFIPHGAQTLGTIGIVVGKTLYGDFDRRFRDWPGEGIDSSLRDTPDDYAPTMQSAPKQAQGFGSGGTSGNNLQGSSTRVPVVLTPTNDAGSKIGSGVNRAADAAPGIRESGTTSDAVASGNGAKAKWDDLDAFYASEEESEETESETEEEEEEGEEVEEEEESDDEGIVEKEKEHDEVEGEEGEEESDGGGRNDEGESGPGSPESRRPRDDLMSLEEEELSSKWR